MEMHSISEYLVKCPMCMSEIRFVAEEANPIFMSCHGCERVIVIQGGVLYTVSEQFVQELLKEHSPCPCGRITGSEISARGQEYLSEQNLSRLHKLLEHPMDVRDFIEKIE